MHPNKLFLLLPVVAAVLISGCTIPGLGGGTATGLGNGVKVLSFAPDFSSVQSGDPVQLQLQVQNQGQYKAINTQAEITVIDVTQWGGTFGATFTTSNMGDLLPFDQETNTPGSIATKIWSLTAPSQPKGLTQQYTPTVKVSYDYKTSAQKQITIVDQNELRRIQQSGGTLASGATVQSAGPISVAITTGAFEKTTTTAGFGYDNVFPVQITITNNGGGFVVPAGTGGGFGSLYGGVLSSYSSDLFGNVINYPVAVRVTPPSGTAFVNLGSFGGSDDCSSGLVTREMFQDKQITITCELQVTSPPTYQEQRTLTVEAFYRYQTQASSSIQVFGKDNGLGGVSGYGY